MRILPGVLKELAKHVPTILFQAIEWNELAQEFPKISRRIIQKEGYAELFEHHEKCLLEEHIKFTTAPIHHQISTQDRGFGDKILTIYFSQLFFSEGIFLDLRSHHFERREETLFWHPTAFWIKLSEEFRKGLIKVYDGFYMENNDLYFEGLKAIGLIDPSWTENDKLALGDLFKRQFGTAPEVQFSLDQLNQAIVGLSDFMLKRKMKIPKDFLYLGIYLVGLYSTLEETSVSYPVKDIYLKVKSRFTGNDFVI